MRFGLAGLGWAARGFHLPALKQLPGVEVVGGYEIDNERRASWVKDTGIPAYDSLDGLLERGQPDVMIVATPPQSHAELTIQALRGGAHVVCEKPFVSTVAEADRVLAVAEATGRCVSVNLEFREKPIFKVLPEHIGSKEHGRLVFCQIWQLMDLAPWDEPVAWRAAMPNRTLFEGGVHSST